MRNAYRARIKFFYSQKNKAREQQLAHALTKQSRKLKIIGYAARALMREDKRDNLRATVLE